MMYRGLSDFDIYALDPLVTHIISYVPPGEVSLNFMNSTALTRLLMGPVGGGKTTTLAFTRIVEGSRQGICWDGWIRDRAVLLRRTWRTAKRTVLKSWQEWFPKDYPGSSWTGGEDRPAVHVLRFQDPSRLIMVDGKMQPVRIELETEFMGLDENNIDAILRGSPYSRGMLNEADQFSKDILEELEARVGRYPKLDDLREGEVRTKSVLGDFNAPDKNNYLYDMFVANPKPGRKLFVQPAGLIVQWRTDGTIADAKVNPLAENLDKLDKDYYTSKAANWEEWRLRRLVLNEWGYSREGLPVFLQEFVERLHVAPAIIPPDPHLPLIIGADLSTGGLRPAAVFLQPDPLGFIRVVETVAPGQGYGAVRFWELVKARIDADYKTCPRFEVWADPAAQYGGDREGGQLTGIEFGAVILGVPVQIPAGGSNELGMRLEIIRRVLGKVVMGERRQLAVSPAPSNRLLIEGFSSSYCFKKRPLGASSQWQAVPDKASEASDPMDALGYGLLGFFRESPSSMARHAVKEGNGRQTAGNFDPAARRNDFDVFKI